MRISGINSYGMGSYVGQAAMNNAKLIQALSNNPRFSEAVQAVSPTENSLKDSLDFVKEYSSGMSSLMKAAAELKSTNSSGTMSDLAVTSSDTAVADVTERLPVRTAGEIQISISETAAAQTNISESVSAYADAAADMDFTVSGSRGSVDVQVSAADSSGAARTNVQMLRDAASQINDSDVGVRATVVEEDGNASLKLESMNTGTAYGFQVSGDLGSAAGVDQVETAGSNARYSVTENGGTREYTSSRNDITVNGGRIGVTLKEAGEVTIRSDTDPEKVASALSDLVQSYNSALEILNDNYGRGTGVDRQLRNLVRGLGPEQSLEMLGITVNKDATLNFDPEVLAKNMETDSSLVKDLISGTGGIADTAFNKAVGGMNMSSGSLINNDVDQIQEQAMNNSYYFMNMFMGGNAYMQNNYYATGLMMNYLI